LQPAQCIAPALSHQSRESGSAFRLDQLHVFEPNPLVRILLTEYRASEIYFFKVLNEHVPVFQKPFRLEQGLILEDTPEARAALGRKENVTVKGTLEYQACNDTTCFLPRFCSSDVDNDLAAAYRSLEMNRQ
jgi:hypothetical protein